MDDQDSLAVSPASEIKQQDRLRQRLHDGLCQQLAASSLLQAALVYRLESLHKPPSSSLDDPDASRLPCGGTGELPGLVDEAKRIRELIHEALEETRAIMQEIGA